MSDSIKAIIRVGGDPAAGIQPLTLEADTGLLPGDLEDSREHVRQLFTDLYRVVLDSDCGVSFSDECQDCGKRLVNGGCPNEQCISNTP